MTEPFFAFPAAVTCTSIRPPGRYESGAPAARLARGIAQRRAMTGREVHAVAVVDKDVVGIGRLARIQSWNEFHLTSEAGPIATGCPDVVPFTPDVQSMRALIERTPVLVFVTTTDPG